jgi:ABC-type uncharacterized transport system involved in gliding motility auxiliary subunit
MSIDPKSTPSSPSFSAAQRWKIGADAVLRTILVLAVVIMANYIASIFPRQIFLSPQTRVKLSSRTVSILQTLTNRVEVTVYYDKSDGMYPTVETLLNEYHRLDPRISVKAVDYERDPAEATQVAEKYHLVSAEKNVIIFDCVGADPPRFKVAPGEALVQYGPEGMTKDKKIEFRPMAFNGEKMFTSMLLAITRPKPFIAYFLQGDGEPSLADTGGTGYEKFGAILGENYVAAASLSLLGNQEIPPDCDLLIIAGPTRRFSDSELSKIHQYLLQGGRLLALFNYFTINQPTGLEDELANWGVNVSNDYVIDRDNGKDSEGSAIFVQNFDQHPAVNALTGSSVLMMLPRPVSRRPDISTDSLTVTELARSSENSVLSARRGFPPTDYPLMVAVEQNTVKGIAHANGSLRMIVAGDSLFLDNQLLDQVSANVDFAQNTVNWLIDRPALLNGIGPSPVVEFRLGMTQKQMRNVRWLLLAALPGVALVLGGAVWLRRRK